MSETQSSEASQRQTEQQLVLNDVVNCPVPTKELVLPELSESFMDMAILPDEREHLKLLKEKFDDATTLYVINGSFGLGDAIMELRYTVLMAQKVKKEVFCQVPIPLLPVLKNLEQKIPNLHFVEKISVESLKDPSTFMLKFYMGKFLNSSVREVFALRGDEYDDENIKNVKEIFRFMESMDGENRVGYDFHFRKPFGKVPLDNAAKYGFSQADLYRSTDYSTAFAYAILGVHISKQEVENFSLISITEEEFLRIEQNLDVVILPDAKEFNTDDQFRSKKSLDAKVWESYFTALKQKGEVRLGIVLGVSHPEYCQQIITLAQKHGLQVQVIEGSLLEVSKSMLKAKRIMGMDSGTTHLALDVQRFAKSHGRQIELVSLFYALAGFHDDYAITGAQTFLFDDSIDKHEKQIVDFMIGKVV